jgi:hypothetical protein
MKITRAVFVEPDELKIDVLVVGKFVPAPKSVESDFPFLRYAPTHTPQQPPLHTSISAR